MPSKLNPEAPEFVPSSYSPVVYNMDYALEELSEVRLIEYGKPLLGRPRFLAEGPPCNRFATNYGLTLSTWSTPVEHCVPLNLGPPVLCSRLCR
jgi:hypothetical protein